jgi:GMP synthase (glutamine-hydrolysing)
MPSQPAGEKILILDFGSQYTQVIARRIRECRVYSEILPYHTKAADIAKLKPSGIILSGGPASVYAAKAPQVDKKIHTLGIPVLGICYGMQLIAHGLGGKVERSAAREYGPGKLKGDPKCALFHKLPATLEVWNSHGDKITKLPAGFRVLGKTENSPHAVIGDTKRHIYGLQFHPEVVHTPRGKEILANFVHRICGCKSNWTMESFIDRTCREIREQVGDGRVILGLSGGVDSSVAAVLLHKALGDQLTCIFVNNGLLRANEAAAVEKLFSREFRIRMKTVDASEQFLKKLKGVTDPERKRKIIGNEFIKVFENAARDLKKSDPGHYRFLAQGTLYPDVIESVSISGNPAALIKSHHNVGGLPEKMKFELVEPLRQLFINFFRM